MYEFLAIAIFLIILISVISKSKPSEKVDKNKKEYEFYLRKALFTPAEKSFYDVLNLSIDKKYTIFGKVRIADVLNPVKGSGRGALSTITSKHFDFVICDSETLMMLCAIELDDKSHNTEKTKIRDELVNNACSSASFPLIRIPAKKSYAINEINSLLTLYLESTDHEEILIATH